jgi:hypothetical protein
VKHLITLCAVVLFAATSAGIASAQTVPSTTASTPTTLSTQPTSGDTDTVAQGNPNNPTNPQYRPPAKPAFIVIHLQAMGTWNIGSSDLPLPSAYCATTQDCGPSGQYQYANPIVHFDYGAQINLSKKWYLFYLHNYIDQNIGRVGVASKVCGSLPCTAAKEFTIPYTYQKLNDDRVDDAALNYVAGTVIVSGGWHQRVRMCCGNPVEPDLANQTAWHDIYFQLATRVGPNTKYFGRLLGITVQEEYIPHNTTSVFKTTGPVVEVVPNAGSLYHTMVTVNGGVPVGDPKTATLAVYAQYLNNFDYFLNAPIPYLYNQVDVGLIKKWPPNITLTVTDSNLYQHHSGYPYTNADVINRNKLIMTLDYALPIR